MSRPRTRQALCGAVLAAAAVVAAVPAGSARSASAKDRVVHYTIPLPKLHRAKVVILELRTQLPPTMSVGGTVAEVTVANIAKLPCYVRAAQVTVKRGPNFWQLFVPIATPKGNVVCGHPTPPNPASKVLLKVHVGPPLSSHPMTLRKLPVDGCKLLRSSAGMPRNGVSLTGFDMSWKQIVHLTVTDDRACR